MPNVLVTDVEIYPNVGYTWGRYDQTVMTFQRERMICSIAWKWLGEPKVECLGLPDFVGYEKDRFNNHALMEEFHKVYNKADIVVAHNGDKFDEKQIRTDFLLAGLEPPKPHETVDTLKIARKEFRLNSNRLDDLAQLLGLGSKVKHEGFGLWLKCMDGDPKAWKRMKSYNARDVVLLEKVYRKLRPWASRHPDISNYERNWNCPKCESPRLIEQGWKYQLASKRKRYQCKACKSWSLGPRIASQK